ncbi:hypothetical protein BJ508DRAFT_371854 [Ascobolus immersus RN42]|uniref:Uncharacterized protein n=1 Tax=Ascobolus immersus RN42 TaxID=1160509 RepID=A0A3N4IS21_ASCIM|nr:hypothetical protein BJ508DRAFT_371854 [Ascobolus immersus RN42]
MDFLYKPAHSPLLTIISSTEQSSQAVFTPRIETILLTFYNFSFKPKTASRELFSITNLLTMQFNLSTLAVAGMFASMVSAQANWQVKIFKGRDCQGALVTSASRGPFEKSGCNLFSGNAWSIQYLLTDARTSLWTYERTDCSTSGAHNSYNKEGGAPEWRCANLDGRWSWEMWVD